MAILKLIPSGKDYLWGGTKLIEQYNKQACGERLAETWELSCHPDGPSYIANGEYKGETLQEYLIMEGKKVAGMNAKRFREFPILIKLIDAREDLSVQVHPDDTYALEHEGQYGKTEMWYVMECEKQAYLYYGFSREIGKDELKQRIEEHTLLEVLNKVEVKKGDVLFIEPGTIHAIGKGIMVAEIQQNSNITYRVYDYGRKGADGKERDLHIEKALQVTERVPVMRKQPSVPHIASCEYFTVDKIVLDGARMQKLSGVIDKSSFVSILVLEGEGMIRDDCEQMRLGKGDSLFLTAGTGAYEISGSMELLLTTIS